MNSKDPPSHLDVRLQEYDYEIQYIPGSKNDAKDALYRRPQITVICDPHLDEETIDDPDSGVNNHVINGKAFKAS